MMESTTTTNTNNNNGFESTLPLLVQRPLEPHDPAANSDQLDGGDQKPTSTTAARAWEESKKVWEIAFPGALYSVSVYGVFVVTQSFVGHISKLYLAAYALVVSISMTLVDGLLLGMSSATETMCGQAYGAQQYHMMGIHLQRSWIINLVTATIVLPLFIFAAPIFNLLGQNSEVSAAAETISLWLFPAAYSYAFSYATRMFLQAQLRNAVNGWLSAGALAAHVGVSWLFVWGFGWGVPGAVGAIGVSQWAIVLGQFVYLFGGWCGESWKGFSKLALRDLGGVVKLSVSSGFMLCLEIWYPSILVLMAGYTSNPVVDLSAFSICFNVYIWVFMIFLGFLGSSCVRVANELGRGDAEAARFSVKVNTAASLALGILFWILFLAFGRDIPYLFTSDDEVAEVAADLSVLLAFTVLISTVQAVLMGVAIGSGKQGRVAIINLFSYYVIGIPFGAILGYVANFGVKGIWMGMICGMSLQVLILGFLTWRIDWNEEVNKTTERLDRFYLDSRSESISS